MSENQEYPDPIAASMMRMDEIIKRSFGPEDILQETIELATDLLLLHGDLVFPAAMGKEACKMCVRLAELMQRYQERYPGVTIERVAECAYSIAEHGHTIPPRMLKEFSLIVIKKRKQGNKHSFLEKRIVREGTILKIHNLLLAGGEQYFGVRAKNKTEIIEYCVEAVERSENDIKKVLRDYRYPNARCAETRVELLLETVIFRMLSRCGFYAGWWFKEAAKLDRHNIKSLYLPNRSFWTFSFEDPTPDSLKRLRNFLEDQRTK